MGCVELLHRDHLAIRALLLQLGSEGPCTPEGVRTLSSEWHTHVEHLEATVAEASLATRVAVRPVLDESDGVRRDITARLETMTSGRCTQVEIVRLAHELVPLFIEHGRAEAAVIATVAPASACRSRRLGLPDPRPDPAVNRWLIPTRAQCQPTKVDAGAP